MSAIELGRFCVFCGKPPNDKTREHILPLWLLNLTGDPDRQASYSFNLRTGKPRSFAADQFVFPACRKCNGDFGAEVEGPAEKVVEALLRRDRVSASQLQILLDWLDKVRVGLWLAFLYLDKNVHNIVPNFHILTRIGRQDRMAAVYDFRGTEKGLSFGGPDSPIFQIMPSCLGLKINDIALLSVSKDFAFSARLGLPFPKKVETNKQGHYAVTEMEAYHKIKSPVLRHPHCPPHLQIFQGVWSDRLYSVGYYHYREQFIDDLVQPSLSEIHQVRLAKVNLLDGLDEARFQSKLVHQTDGGARVLSTTDTVGFESRSAIQARTLGEVFADAYSLLEHYWDASGLLGSDSFKKVALGYNRSRIAALRSMRKGRWKALSVRR